MEYLQRAGYEKSSCLAVIKSYVWYIAAKAIKNVSYQYLMVLTYLIFLMKFAKVITVCAYLFNPFIAYFNGEDIVKIVWEGFTDEDNALIDAQLLQAKKDYAQTGGGAEGEAENGAESAQEAGDAPVASAHSSADPFAALKEMEGDEE